MQCCTLWATDAALYERARAPGSGVQATDAPSRGIARILKHPLLLVKEPLAIQCAPREGASIWHVICKRTEPLAIL